MPWNPSGSRWYQARGDFIEYAIVSAVFTNRDLLGRRFPVNYDELLSSGLLPIVFENRYTAEPIKSTPEYSPGDIYYEADPASGLFRLYRHQGELDLDFDPEATEGKDLPWTGSPTDTVTDGKSIKTEIVLGPEAMAGSVPPSRFRIDFDIPTEDEARVRVLIVYRWVNDFMGRMGEFVDQVPLTLDDYIDFVGQPNPVAWTNPYSGEPMKQVDWYDVPLYFCWERAGKPVTGLSLGESEPPEDIAGDYAFTVAPSPVVEGEMRAYALFYFKQPDGTPGAYLAMGIGPQEFLKGTISLD